MFIINIKELILIININYKKNTYDLEFYKLEVYIKFKRNLRYIIIFGK